MPPHRLLTVLAVSVVGLVLGSAALAHGTARTEDQTLTGTLRTWHGDTLDAPVAVGAGIDPGISPLVPLAGAEPTVHKLAGKRVTAKGRFERGAFAAGGGVQAAGGSVVAATTGAKTVGVILFNFTNNSTTQPWTHATVRGVLFDSANSVDAYYREASWRPAVDLGRRARLVHDPGRQRRLRLHGLGDQGAHRGTERGCQPLAPTSTSSMRSPARRVAAGPGSRTSRLREAGSTAR